MKNLGKVVLVSSSLVFAQVALPAFPIGVEIVEAASSVKLGKVPYETTANLNMRTGPGTNYKVVITIPKGKKVTATEKKGNWLKVSYTYTSKGKSYTKTGWVSNSYLKEVKSNSSKPATSPTTKITKTTYQTTANVNMRTGAGTKYSIILTIPKGKTITATEKSGSWLKVSFTYTSKGKSYTKTGWVSNSYLKEVKSNPSKPVTSPTTKITKTTYQTTANVNMRTGAGTKYSIILTITKGKTITATEKSGSWLKVSYTYVSNGKTTTKTGWIDSRYVKEYDQHITTAGTYYFTQKAANLYAAPNSKNKAAASLAKDHGLYSTIKVINSIGQTWYQVSYNGKTLYVFSGDVKPVAPKSIQDKKFVTNKDTYVYQSLGYNYTKLVKIPKDTVVSSNLSIGAWYKITYNGKTGYVPVSDLSDYQEPAIPAPENPGISEEAISNRTFLVTVNLNLRKEASTNTEVLDTIPINTVVEPTHKTTNGWFKLSYNGKVGYVSGEYLDEIKIPSISNEIEPYLFLDLRTPSKVSADHINQYIVKYIEAQKQKGIIVTSILTNKGQAFINAGNKYGVNPLFLAALAIHESGYGTSLLSLGKHNLFGFGAYDATPYIAAYRFQSVDAAIEYLAQELKATYLNEAFWKYKGAYLGYSVKRVKDNSRVDQLSKGMNFYYASDPEWGIRIATHMQNIFPYHSDHYKDVQPDTKVPARPAIPNGSDIFPRDILAVANQNLVFYSSKKVDNNNVVINKGTKFTLLEKTNDYWIKVRYGGKEYWSNSIKFDNYKNYLSVKNLARVTATELNIRSQPSTTSSKIGQFKQNEYITLALDQYDKLIKDSTGKWYQVILEDGKKAWVHGDYIKFELQ